MRAIVLSELGPPQALVLREVDEPVVAPGQALIEVELASITFVETQVRAGRAPNPAMVPPLPATPGNGVGGTVVAVGDGADRGLVGARVVSTTGGTGGYAERVAVDAANLIGVPDGVALADAIALLADGRTALGLMRGASVQPGETVLVEAAAGGVGSLLVQLAKQAGAHVVAAAGGERKLTIARELGADVVVDYTHEGWAQELARGEAARRGDDAADADAPDAPAGDDVAAGAEAPADTTTADPVLDVVFDGVGGAIGRAAFELLRPGGRHSAYGMASGAFARIDEDEARERGVTLVRGAPPSPAETLARSRAALDLAAAGRLRPIIGQTFPLERAADAHRAIEARATIGKTLLLVR